MRNAFVKYYFQIHKIISTFPFNLASFILELLVDSLKIFRSFEVALLYLIIVVGFITVDFDNKVGKNSHDKSK